MLQGPGEGRGGATEICDIVRDMFECATMEDVAKLLHSLRCMHFDKEIEIVRFKDRFFDTKTTGWRDAMINYRVPSAAPELKGSEHICEVQIVHKKLLMCRDHSGLGGHDGYARERNASEFLEYLGEEVPTRTGAPSAVGLAPL